METISTAELVELAYLERDYFVSQFQYWLAVTFAVITAAYVAGDGLSTRIRSCLFCLYLLSTLLFYSLNSLSTESYFGYKVEVGARGIGFLSTMREAEFVGTLRFVVSVIGTLTASWFLLKGGSLNTLRTTKSVSDRSR